MKFTKLAPNIFYEDVKAGLNTFYAFSLAALIFVVTFFIRGKKIKGSTYTVRHYNIGLCFSYNLKHL
ncbi:MAG TPA: hypothetical protein VKI61_03985 [Chitinophagaceae bacterium]|nr:hypothetical protein [Chitinophagaceae bacterium]